MTLEGGEVSQRHDKASLVPVPDATQAAEMRVALGLVRVEHLFSIDVDRKTLQHGYEEVVTMLLQSLFILGQLLIDVEAGSK